MMKKQQGFTLIELVAVIVILGALAVVALPRFIDLQDEAEQAAAEGVAGSLSAASALNYAAFVADATGEYDQISGSLDADPATGSDLADLLQDSTALSEYAIVNCDVGTTNGSTDSTCELQKAGGTSFDETVNFTAIAASN